MNEKDIFIVEGNKVFKVLTSIACILNREDFNKVAAESIGIFHKDIKPNQKIFCAGTIGNTVMQQIHLTEYVGDVLINIDALKTKVTNFKTKEVKDGNNTTDGGDKTGESVPSSKT